jgi:UTP--glucose-1-phosphate uridylyltransferase
MKAVITAAAKNHRHLGLQTVTDARGFPTTILSVQVQDLVSAGVDRIGVVINPGDEPLFREAAGDQGDRLVFIPQPSPLGYGHAIACARDFVGGEDFILTIGDHLFVSSQPQKNCIQQVVEAGLSLKSAVSAVQATPENDINRFGTVGGQRTHGRSDLIKIKSIIEKPTPTLAEQELLVPGLRSGFYYSNFGIHYLPARIFDHLDALLRQATDSSPRVNLTDALNRLLEESEAYALEVKGYRFDLEARFGLLEAQIAMALRSDFRDQVLTSIVALLARP